MKIRAWRVAAFALATTACSLDTEGTGVGNSELGSSGGSTGGETTSSAGSTSATTEGTDTTDPTGGSTTDPTTTSTTSTTDATGEPGQAMLVIAEAPEIDFGDVDLDDPVPTEAVTVSNEGDGDATALEAMLPGPYAFAGGAYPGTGGDCGGTLGADETCTMVVELAPATFGPLTSTLTLDYDDGMAAAAVNVDLTGAGIGTTANLLANPGGETSGNPPPSWNEINGNWTTTTQFSRSGARSIYGGDVNGNDGPFNLEQEIDISEYAAIIDDGGGLEVSFIGYARSFGNNNDDFAIRLRALDGGGDPIATDETDLQDQNDFTLMETGFVTPAQTRTIEARLLCLRTSGDFCDAYFDDLELTLTYPAP